MAKRGPKAYSKTQRSSRFQKSLPQQVKRGRPKGTVGYKHRPARFATCWAWALYCLGASKPKAGELSERFAPTGRHVDKSQLWRSRLRNFQRGLSKEGLNAEFWKIASSYLLWELLISKKKNTSEAQLRALLSASSLVALGWGDKRSGILGIFTEEEWRVICKVSQPLDPQKVADMALNNIIQLFNESN